MPVPLEVSSSVPTADELSAGPTRTTVSTSAVIVAPARSERKSITIINAGTTVIKIGLGPIDPTSTVYFLALAAATTPDDGTGGAMLDSEWNGEVRAISNAPGGIVLVTELRRVAV